MNPLDKIPLILEMQHTLSMYRELANIKHSREGLYRTVTCN